MNISFNHLSSIANETSFLFKESLLPSLNEQKKKFLVIISAILVFLAACYFVIKYTCFKGEKLKNKVVDISADDAAIKNLPKNLTEKISSKLFQQKNDLFDGSFEDGQTKKSSERVVIDDVLDTQTSIVVDMEKEKREEQPPEAEHSLSNNMDDHFDEPKLSKLPINNLLHIFTFLGAEELGRMTRTCRILRSSFINNQQFWKHIAQNILNIPKNPQSISWRDCVIIRENWLKNIYIEKPVNLPGFLKDCEVEIKKEDFPDYIKEKGYSHMMLHKGDYIVYQQVIIEDNWDEMDIFNIKLAVTDTKGVLIHEFQVDDIEIKFNRYDGETAIFDYCLQTNRLLWGQDDNEDGEIDTFYIGQIPKDVSRISLRTFEKIACSASSLYRFGGNFPMFNTKIPQLKSDCLIVYNWGQGTKEVFPVPKLHNFPNSRSRLTIIGDILVELTGLKEGILIGYQLQHIEDIDGNEERQWKEIWRNCLGNTKEFEHVIMYPNQDETALLFDADYNYKNRSFIIYNPLTGKEITKLAFTGHTQAQVYFQKMYYLKYNEIICRDYSPIKQ